MIRRRPLKDYKRKKSQKLQFALCSCFVNAKYYRNLSIKIKMHSWNKNVALCNLNKTDKIYFKLCIRYCPWFFDQKSTGQYGDFMQNAHRSVQTHSTKTELSVTTIVFLFFEQYNSLFCLHNFFFFLV